MSGRSIRAAVANPQTPSTTLSSCLSLAAPCIAATCRRSAPLWHGLLAPWPGGPADHVLTKHRAPQSLHPARQMRVRGALAAASVSPGQIPLGGGWRAQPQAAPCVRLLAAQISRLDDLRVAPDGVLLAEVEVVVGHFLEGRVLGRLVLDHLEPRLLEGGQVLVAP